MIEIVCSDALRPRLERELASAGIPTGTSAETTTDSRWVLVERGNTAPDHAPAIVFDALDYVQVVRLLASGIRGSAQTPRTMIGQRDDAFVVLAARDVLVIEAADDGAIAVTASGTARMRGTLQQIETTWGPLGFVRANRSQLANLSHVREIVPWFNSRYVLRITGGNDVEVSKMYAKHLRARLGI